MTKVLIIGLGKTGMSFADYLSAKGVAFDFVDTRQSINNIDELKNKYPSSKFYLASLEECDLGIYSEALISPGVDLRDDLVAEIKAANIAINGDIHCFIKEINSKVVGITGSNGKSTLTEMLDFGFKALGLNSIAGGNLGLPALDLLKEEVKEIYTLELSSFQLDSSKNLPLDVALILNISEDHLDRYDSYKDYIDSKLSIYTDAKIKIINLDESYSENVEKQSMDVTFSMKNDLADVYFNENNQSIYVSNECICQLKNFELKGKHNASNILAAVSVAKALNIDVIDFSKLISKFKGLEHRCEFVGLVNGLTWINDSKGTNVGATIAAMKGFDEPMTLLMGGQAKGASFEEFAKELSGHVLNIILFGQDAKIIYESVSNIVNTILVKDLESAVTKANEISEAGAIVLFSPACASLDMFSNYEQRGNEFKNHVRGLAA